MSYLQLFSAVNSALRDFFKVSLRTNSNSFFVIGIWAVDNLTEIIVKNIVKEKGPMVDGPTAREIQAESMKILDGRRH